MPHVLWFYGQPLILSVCVWEGAFIFQELGLVKLTWRISRRKEIFVRIGAPQTHERLSDRQLRLICHHMIRRRGRNLGFNNKKRQFTGRWKEQMFGKQMLAMPCRDNGTWRGLCTKRPCWVPPSLLNLAHTLRSYLWW